MIVNVLTIPAQLQKIIPKVSKTVLKTVIELLSARGLNYMGKEIKIIPEGKQDIPVNFSFTFIVKVSKDSAVFTQQTMNISDIVV